MSSIEIQLNEAVGTGKVPQVVLYATDGDASFNYSYATGKTSVEVDAESIGKDALFLLASQTKLLTAVAALQVVERGLIKIDDEVHNLLPELAQQLVLTGFDDNDQPVLAERRNPITFKHLLTHTAGTAYDAANSNLTRYQTQRGVTPNTGPDVLSRFGTYPLIFQPGEAWSYGSGLDWAGLVIERLTKSTLEDYMRANIWEPLGIKSMTFFPEKAPDLAARIPRLSARGPDGKLSPYTGPFITTGATGCFGGHGAYSSMDDYLLLLRSLLSNDGKLLRPDSVDELFKPQLTPAQAQSHKEVFESPLGALFIGEFDMEKYRHDWAFGGVVFVDGYEDGRRSAGTLSWGGAANCFWLMDREAGIALTFGTQVIPPGDGEVGKVISVVEKGVYAMAGKA